MSLVAWFPLNGDLHNQGLDNVTLVKANATFTNDGKIGQCVSSNHTASDYFIIPSLVNGKKMSITYWARIDIATTTNWLDGVYWRTTPDGTTYNANRQEFYNEKTDLGTMNVGFWFAGNSLSGYTVSLYDWHHFALVIDYSTGYSAFYVDGILKGTKMSADTTHSIEGRFRIFDTNIDASECDVRFYNHCLSEKEVHEISKGLVAHYKLTEPLLSTDTTVYDCSGYNYHGSPLGTLTTSSDTARYSSSTSFDGSSSGVLIENLYLASIINSDITYSFWIKPNGENGSRSIYFGSYNSKSWSLEKTNTNVFRLYWDGSPDETCTGVNISDGVWQHICITKKGTNDVKVYYNGELSWTSTATHSNLNFPTTYRIGRDYRSGDGTPYKGLMSDFRIYSTTLSAEDVLELYHTGESISKDKTLFAYSYNEPANGELMNVKYTNGYTTHTETNPWTAFNSQGEATFTANNQSIGSVYVPVNPTGKTYYYDMQLSINAGNRFYVGFERYDADKTPRSNNACVYVYATRPTTDVVKQRFRGTVNLSTDGVNPCAFVTLRVLNGWSGTTSGVTGQATIHYLSLREVDNATGFHTSFGKNGVVTTDLLLDKNGDGDIEKTGIVNMTNFIEV